MLVSTKHFKMYLMKKITSFSIFKRRITSCNSNKINFSVKKLFIHGGYQRCATTYLQEAIFINLRDFECLGKPTHLFGASNRNYYYEKRKELNRDQSIVKLNELQEKHLKENIQLIQVYPETIFFTLKYI